MNTAENKRATFPGVEDGQTFKVAGFEFIKFPSVDGKTPVVMRDVAFRSRFGDNNDLRASDVLKKMEKDILPKIIAAVGEENVLEIDVKERFGDDVAIYPLHFLSLKLVPTSATPKGDRYITLSGIIEVFAGPTTDLETVKPSDINTQTKFIKDGSLYIQSGNKIYDVLGTQISK